MMSKIFLEKPETTKINGEKWIRVIPGAKGEYQLYNALAEGEQEKVYLGRILFDVKDHWIYDGELLNVNEQEELAGFITNYKYQMKDLLDSLNEVVTVRTNSDDADFRLLTGELDGDLRERNGDLMDVYDQHNMIIYTDFVVLAYLNGELAGCGCFKEIFNDAAELKRMYVRKSCRGKGVSRAILNQLEEIALENGYTYTILETGSKQVEALGLYQKSGYTLMPNYGPYIDLRDSICFKKRLV